ncbi:hypothetical protein ACJRO7_014610 [Eucalyptus globulus]|uniref:Uncharacterized protein n=1 Tax=Eucalyptus globulus TaxID=34317 RepID=A0ABD3L0S1_EUCGL
MADYLWNHGLISDTTYGNIRNFCAVDRNSDGCNKAWDEAYMNEFVDVNNFNLFMRPSASPIQDLMFRDGFGHYSDNDKERGAGSFPQRPFVYSSELYSSLELFMIQELQSNQGHGKFLGNDKSCGFADTVTWFDRTLHRK